MPVSSLAIKIKSHPYQVHWFLKLTDLRSFVLKNILSYKGKQLIITNHKLKRLFAKELKSIFSGIEIVAIADGEHSKSLSTIEQLSNILVKRKIDRSSRLIAFGGGVIGDITGFLAASYMRGIPFVQVPTTLLAMVDSSVGGKTGVNLALGKNMVGAFHQPDVVLMHIPFLKSLPEREYKCGLVEAFKSALIQDAKFVQYFQEHSSVINKREEQTLLEISMKSVAIKNSIVARDEKELGLRAVLNLGHTLAHAIESILEYKTLNHGEAVSIGLIFALTLSVELSLMSSAHFNYIDAILKNLQLPRRMSALKKTVTSAQLIQLMKSDKKNHSGKIAFVLLDRPGKVRLAEYLEDSIIDKSLKSFIKLK